MKKVFIHLLIAASVVLSLSSCDKERGSVQKNDTVSVSFDTRAGKCGTKAGAEDYESEIRSLDVLVFRTSNGALEDKVRATGSTASVYISRGVEVRYYVIANAPSSAFSSITTEEAVSSVAAQLSSIPTSGFEMIASGTGTFIESEKIDVVLERLACKISVEGVTVSFMDTSLGNATVTIDSFFLINVNGSEPYSLTPTDNGVWYNKLALTESQSGDVYPLIVDNAATTVTSSAIISDRHCLYCMPNPVDIDTDSRTSSSWSPRRTRLVMQMTIGGSVNYYPITLPIMAPNHHYIVNNIIVSNFGSDAPDKPVQLEDITFSIDVKEWGTENKEVTFN